MEHYQPGALQPQGRDHGEQERPCPRGGTGEKELANKLLLMVILFLACRTDGPVLCVALPVLCILYLFAHLRALTMLLPQTQTSLCFVPAVQPAASDTVKSRYFPIFHVAEVVPHCFISCSPASMICSLRQGEREHFRCTGPVGRSVFMLEVLYHSTFSFKPLPFSLLTHSR